jgi:hypothetical protein
MSVLFRRLDYVLPFFLSILQIMITVSKVIDLEITTSETYN